MQGFGNATLARYRWVLFSTVVLIALLLVPSQMAFAAPSTAGGKYFAQTGFSLRDPFLKYYEQHQGQRILGLPISEERSEDGLAVQYFERQRLEYHPADASGRAEVVSSLLGRLLTSGRDDLQPIAPFPSSRTNWYIQQTGHSLSNAFLDFWLQAGGVEAFGYPISEELHEQGLLVQWFERARFEYHPELEGTGFAVQLSRLGAQYLEQRQGQVAEPSRAAQEVAGVTASKGVNPALEAAMVEALNAQRSQAGARMLRTDARLIEIARRRSLDMATRDYFAHSSPDGITAFDLLDRSGIGSGWAGENLARNNYADGDTTAVAISGFMSSPSHRENVLNPHYFSVGVGEVTRSDGMKYFTVIFIGD